MSSNLSLLAATASLSAVASLAYAETPLKPSMCEKAASGGFQISHENLTGALLDGLKIPYVVTEIGHPEKLGERIAAAGFCTPDTCGDLQKANTRTLDLLTASSTKFKLVWLGGAATEPKDQDGAFRQLYQPQLNSYRVDCSLSDAEIAAISAPKPPSPPKTEDGGPKSELRVAQDIDAAEQSFKKRSPATFSFTSQRTASDAFGIKGALVWYNMFPLPKATDPNAIQKGLLLPRASSYIQVEQTSNPNPAKRIDDLQFGLRLSETVFGNTLLHLTGSWTTDAARFRSSIGKLELRGMLPLLNVFPGYDGYANGVPSENRFTISPIWRIYAVADYVEVGSAKGRPALAGIPQYGRLGFDLQGGVRVGGDLEHSSVFFSGQYAYRGDVSGHRGSADLLSLGAELRPSDDSHYSFKFSYDNGTVLDTLERESVVKASIGFKN